MSPLLSVPGLQTARAYRREWFTNDLVAGVSVAAVALPVGIAYAQLAGFPPVVGIYSSILPLVAYALFGSSRQLIVNPDAAACAMVAATLVPMAADDAVRYSDLSIGLTFLTGALCIAGGLAGFGAIANFLSRPILTGYLNGIALSIIAGQLATLLGFHVASAGFLRTVGRVALRLNETHAATLALGVMLFLLLRLLRRFVPRAPASLVAAVLGIVIVYALGPDGSRIEVVGPVPAGFPAPRIPSIGPDDWWPLTLGACGIVIVSFCSMMTTARGFAVKNHYAIDTSQDMIALGVCDLASCLSRGFVVSGADSRTAVADAAGGQTQLTGVVAAATMALVLLFLTGPLTYLPRTALAAILISSALGLFDLASLRTYYRVSKPEFRHSLAATIGVMSVGVLPGVLIAVGLAIIRLLRLASRPYDARLGVVDGEDGIYSVEGEGGQRIPGLVIYRFDAALVFFNADYFVQRVLALSREGEAPKWVLFDAEATPTLDVTGAQALDALRTDLSGQGITLAIARAKGRFLGMLERTGVAERIGASYLFPTVHSGVRAYLGAQERAVQPRDA